MSNGRTPITTQRERPGSTWMVLANLGAALVMGIIIGVERQYNQHPAGLRTNALVCVGCRRCSCCCARLVRPTTSPEHIAGQIVTGVGFLGGGVILPRGARPSRA